MKEKESPRTIVKYSAPIKNKKNKFMSIADLFTTSKSSLGYSYTETLVKMFPTKFSKKINK